MVVEAAHGSAGYNIYSGGELVANTYSHTYIGYDRPSKSATSITTYVRCAIQSSRDLSSYGYRAKYYNWPGFADDINHYITTWEETGWVSAASTAAGGTRSHTSGIRQSVSATSSASWTAPARHTCNFYRNYNSSDTTKTATDTGWGSATGFAADNYTFPSNPSRTGYTFNGWYTARSGGTKYTSASCASDLNLYAQWTEITYPITFNKNDSAATGSMSQINKGSGGAAAGAAGASITIPACSFTKEGYHFVGWATSASGAVAYQPGSTYNINAALTLYAKWEVNYVKPGFSQLPVVQRCNSAGTPQDDGTYVSIEFDWFAFDATFANYIYNNINTSTTQTRTNSTIYVTYRLSSSSSDSSMRFTVKTNTHTSGSLTGHVKLVSQSASFSIDNTYSISIYIQDVLNDPVPALAHTGWITTFVSTSFFTMDVFPNGMSVGFGCSAPDPTTEYGGAYAANGILKTNMQLIAGIDLTITEVEYNTLMGLL